MSAAVAPQRVIVAGSNVRLLNLISTLLREEYGLETIAKDDFHHLISEIRTKTFELVILAQPLPGYTTLQNTINTLLEIYDYNVPRLLVIEPDPIARHAASILTQSRTHRVWIISETKTAIRSGLEHFGFHPLRLPNIEFDSEDLILRAQLQLLDPAGNPIVIKRRLARIVAQIWPDFRTVIVRRLKQGYSGSMVLHLRCPQPQKGAKRAAEAYALKISKAEEFPKIQRWTQHWPQIDSALNDRKLIVNRPHPVQPAYPVDQSGLFVCVDGFFAEAWQYVGEPTGDAVDLELAYRARMFGRYGAALAETILARHLEMLQRVWYNRARFARKLILWSTGASKPHFDESLPYVLSTNRVADILIFFEANQHLGRKHLKSWQRDLDCIVNWIRAGPNKTAWVAKPQTVVLSEIHGDLNRNNLRFWISRDHPLLIDFVTYKSKGHLLQDFANLEAELKFALMDTEWDSPLEAFDLTGSRVVNWCEYEPWLLREIRGQTRGRPRSSPGYDTGIQRALEAVILIRNQARRAYATAQDGGFAQRAFANEYAAALLYQTLLYISYETISPFKKIFAAFSAANIIRFLNASR